MEALVAIFGEIIIACLMPVLGILGALLGAVFEAFLLLFGGVFSEYVQARRSRRAQAAGQPAPVRKPWVSRKLVHWVAGGCACMGVAGVLASVVFFQPILRYVMVTASDKAGMSISYETASGSLLGGHVVLEGLEMARAHPTGLAFDMRVARAEADVDLWSLLSDRPRLILGQVDGVEGFVTPPLPKEKSGGLRKPRRAFMADRMSVQDVALEIRPRNSAPYSLVIVTGEVAPFRSGLALFDLLFRSNLQAELAGQSLLVETREITENGRETRWQFEDVDARQLRMIVPRAPLTWIEAGRADVVVSDRWSLSDDFVDMDWQMSARGLKTTVPEGARATERVLAQGLTRYVAAKGGDVSFQYRLQLDEQQMQALRRGDLSQFWDVVLSGILKGGARLQDLPDETPDPPPEAESEKPGLMDRMKSIFGQDKAAD